MVKNLFKKIFIFLGDKQLDFELAPSDILISEMEGDGYELNNYPSLRKV